MDYAINYRKCKFKHLATILLAIFAVDALLPWESYLHIKVCFRLGAGQTKAVKTQQPAKKENRARRPRGKKTWGRKNAEQGKRGSKTRSGRKNKCKLLKSKSSWKNNFKKRKNNNWIFANKLNQRNIYRYI